MAEAMKARSVVPECECFDLGIVRSVKMYEEVGMLARVSWKRGKEKEIKQKEREREGVFV